MIVRYAVTADCRGASAEPVPAIGQQGALSVTGRSAFNRIPAKMDVDRALGALRGDRSTPTLQALTQCAALGIAEQMPVRAQQTDNLLMRQLGAPGKLGGCRLLDRFPVGRGGGSSKGSGFRSHRRSEHREQAARIRNLRERSISGSCMLSAALAEYASARAIVAPATDGRTTAFLVRIAIPRLCRTAPAHERPACLLPLPT